MKLSSKKGDESLGKYLEACLEKYNKRAMNYVLVKADEQNHGAYDKERT